MTIQAKIEYSVVRDGKRIYVEPVMPKEQTIPCRIVGTDHVIEVRFNELQAKWTKEPE